MNASYTLTLAFAAFLLATLGVKFWLASRQIRHVARHRDAVPAPFAGIVTLPAHQKAADYTITKTRFGLPCFWAGRCWAALTHSTRHCWAGWGLG